MTNKNTKAPTKIFGYHIYGELFSDRIDGFVIDEQQVHLITDSIKAGKIIAAAIAVARDAGESVQINNFNFSVEVILHEVYAPRYVLLRGIQQGNRFITRYDGNEGYGVCNLSDGTLAYQIIGFADTYSEAQCLLYGRSRPSFAHTHTLDIGELL